MTQVTRRLPAPPLSRRRRVAGTLPMLLLLGGMAAANAVEAKELPPWMRTPGGADQPYGQPSKYEAQVIRTPSANSGGIGSWQTPIERQRGIVTPNGLHFSVHHNGLPQIDPARHRLVIHGLVDHPVSYSLEQLDRYPMVSRLLFLECAGNSATNAVSPFPKDLTAGELSGQVSGAEWTGVPLSVLLKEAGVRPEAKWVIVEGADGGSHQRSLPLEKLMDDTLVALYQNGERIRPSQGYPMRLFVPGWEGNVNVKWVHRLEVTDRPAFTKDESGLYTEVLADGRIERFTFPMEVKSLITHPSGRQQLPKQQGYFEISGLAWSGCGRITRVEVSRDGGKSWSDARLDEPVLPKALTRFSLPWKWNGKPTVLKSRAHDDHGHVQPTRTAWKARYAAHSFNHYNAIQAWKITGDGKVVNTYE